MIVGIGSSARAGKDTAAQALCKSLDFSRVAFADKLKQMAIICDPLVTASVQRTNVGIGNGRLAHVAHGLGWEDAKDVYPEVRAFLQNLGAAAREVLDEDIWVSSVMDDLDPDKRYVIPDVRYPNEVQAIRDADGILIRIHRPGVQVSDHPSETGLSDDMFDHVIVNDGSVVELESAVVQLVRDELAARESRTVRQLTIEDTDEN